MTRALETFSVGHGALRLRVRLLPNVRSVDLEYRAGRRRRNGLHVHAYFAPARRSDARHVGTIALAANGRLAELVPHEVTHAVMHWLERVEREADERLATLVGLLTARILARIRRLGYAV